jgi:hypothetical protein
VVAFAAVHMSLPGTSRHCAATQQFSRFRSKADTNVRFAERIYEYAPSQLYDKRGIFGSIGLVAHSSSVSS